MLVRRASSVASRETSYTRFSGELCHESHGFTEVPVEADEEGESGMLEILGDVRTVPPVLEYKGRTT